MDDGWDRLGKSVERSVDKAVVLIGTGLLVVGVVAKACFDVLRHRHRA